VTIKRQKPLLEVDACGLASRKGLEHPFNQRSQDNCFLDDSSPLVAVFDGVGGDKYGDVASGIASAVVYGKARAAVHVKTTREATRFLTRIVWDISDLIRQVNQKLPGAETMATTIAMALVLKIDKTWKLFTAHLGDSRVYLWSKGHLMQLTVDHNVTREMTKTDFDAIQMTREMIEVNSLDDLSAERRVLARRLNVIHAGIDGTKQLIPHLGIHNLDRDDWFMLTTDGVHDQLRHEVMEKILKDSEYPEIACRAMIETVRTGKYKRKKIPPTLYTGHDDDALCVIGKLDTD
jgi:serine/threonine protein phosphatase PrpC